MSAPRGDGGSDPIRVAYRRLLRLYPRRFRERYAADLLQAFDDRRGEPRFRGVPGGVRLVSFLLRDFVSSVPMAYEPTRQTPWDVIMGDFVRDLQYSVRMLVKNPMFTVAAVVTLALGIGLNTATFTAVRHLLLAPLPGAAEPDELVQLYRQWPGIEFGSTSIPHYQDIRDRSGEVFENVAAWNYAHVALSSNDRTERLIALLVSANFFQTYGVTPLLGRAFIPGVEDTGPGAHSVTVLGHGFWQTRFGGDPGVIGRTITLNGRPFEVVGVAPPDFGGPLSLLDTPFYVPIMMLEQIMPGSPLLELRGSNSFNTIARLRDGRSLAQAQDVLDGILLQLGEEYPAEYEEQVGTRLVPQGEAGIHPSFGGAQTGMGAVMMGVVALLLLIACVNVANLFLARARDRRREMGIRLSLGAGRGRIVRQLLTESVLFAMIAGVAGLALAQVATGLLHNFRPPIDGPWTLDFDADGAVLGFTLLVSVAVGVLFGMAPAMHATRSDAVSAVKGVSEGGAGRSRVSSTLVVAQMALSLLLLISSGLFLRALESATDIDPGFDDPAHLVTASVDPSLLGYDEAASHALLDRIVAGTAALPGVTSVAVANRLPLGLGSSDTSVEIPGYEFAENEPRSVFYSVVREGYFETMGIELLEGRTFTRADDGEAAPVLVINQRFAQRFWPGESAVGRRVRTGSDEREVIGVVETGKYNSLGEAPAEFMYLPHREIYRSSVTLLVRSARDPLDALQGLREVVRAADPDLPLFDVRTMEDHMGIALLPARLGGTVLGVFGLLGLALAGVGIYGVMAYSVAQRRRELGIRVALGADRSLVVRLVVGEGMKLALVGAAIGLVGAFGAARLVQGLLYGVPATDPVAFLGVPTLLLGVAWFAVYLPARRAASVDPIGALKAE